MKTILIFICLSFSIFPAAAQGISLAMPITRAIAYEEVKQSQLHLYETIRKQLQQYYNRSDFVDSDHTTGWYRVADFLTWLKTNEIILARDVELSVLILNNPQVLWVYLGARYIADRYGTSTNAKNLQVQLARPHSGTRALVQDATILLDPSENLTPPAAITLGMHEGAHLLPLLADTPQQNSLSELAAFYAQHQYGLPVEIEDAKWFSYGIRDIRLTSTRKGYALVPLTREYTLHIVGLVILPHLSSHVLLDNLNRPMIKSDLTITTAVMYWHALTKQQLVDRQNSYSQENFLERLLGPLAQNSIVCNQTIRFFNMLEEGLSQELQDSLNECLPVEIEQSSDCLQRWETYMDQHPQLLIPVINQVLKEMNVLPPPPVPHGYL